MATPAQLMETISLVTGTPMATVIDIDRKLTKAGLRTKGGRGFSAAQMTPRDAAHLLTAMLAAPQSTDAALAVERYMHTCIDEERSSRGLFGATGLGDLVGLTARHGFIDSLVAVIVSATGGGLSQLRRETGGDWKPRIEVFAFTRVTRARIRISGLPSRATASVEYIPIGRPKAPPIDDIGDLEQSRRITGRTIFSVAELLGLEGDHE